MAERRDHRDGHGGGDGVVDPRTAIAFITRSIDRLESSIERMQQTVREDFASTGDVELIKLAVHTLREEMARRLKAVEDRLDAIAQEPPVEVRVSRWLIWVGIPGGALALLKLAWDLFGAHIKKGP